MQDGEAVLALEAKPASDEGLLLRAAAAAAQAGLPLSPHAVERLAAEGPRPAGAVVARRARVLRVPARRRGRHGRRSGRRSTSAGVIGRLIPGWDVVRSAPQRNALHRFTVDRHLVETAVQASALTRNVDRPDLLLVGALLHDIGKARGGDHSVVGADLADGIAARMGFDEADRAVIVALVRHHLLLADTATRQDLEDPQIIGEVAGVLGDVGVLDLLHELTIADSLATGPTVCTDWRFSLINDLAERVRASMAGRPLPEPPELTDQQEVALRQSGVWVLMDVRDATCVVTVAAPDRVGLLALVAGVLSLNRLNVLAARVRTRRRTAPSRSGPCARLRRPAGDRAAQRRHPARGRRHLRRGGAPRQARRGVRPQAALEYPEPIRAVPRRARAGRPSWRSGPTTRRACSIGSRAPWPPPDATIVGAKVSTLGSDAVDVFFVTDATGAPLTRRPHGRAAGHRAVVPRRDRQPVDRAPVTLTPCSPPSPTGCRHLQGPARQGPAVRGRRRRHRPRDPHGPARGRRRAAGGPAVLRDRQGARALVRGVRGAQPGAAGRQDRARGARGDPRRRDRRG